MTARHVAHRIEQTIKWYAPKLDRAALELYNMS